MVSERTSGGSRNATSPTTLKRVDPKHAPSRFARVYAAVAATSVAKFISRHVNWKIDPLLLRLTRGRFATTLVFPTALLETRGARSGARRHNAIIYFHDGDRVTIAASNAGAPRHPAWFHNLQADPQVTFGGSSMLATVVVDAAERERLWALADRVFPAFANYRRDAAKVDRTIPLIQLTRVSPHESVSGGVNRN
jgi:deazaflavin-dependent oxidoreductase (nitroreductase family)